MQLVLERMRISLKSKHLFYEESLQQKWSVSKGMSIDDSVKYDFSFRQNAWS